MNDLRLKRRPRRAAGTAADRTTRTKTMNCREVAAEYIGISASTFDLGVKDGTLPKPQKFRGRAIWDRRELDLAFDELPCRGDENPWDAVLAS
jgi:predicted DNA-binding transcriptional regulator AlpA